MYDNVHYILSDDIGGNNAGAVYVQGGDEVKIEDVNIIALPSTDQGVAYLVHTEHQWIYHAGDLNWWHWQEDNSAAQNEQAKQDYLSAIAMLNGMHLRIGFVVLDPRQENRFYYGLHALMQICHIDYVFPMHLWGDYQTIHDFKRLEISAPYRDRIVAYDQVHRTFCIPSSQA